MAPKKKGRGPSRAASSPSGNTTEDALAAKRTYAKAPDKPPTIQHDSWTDDQEAVLFKGMIHWKPENAFSHTGSSAVEENEEPSHQFALPKDEYGQMMFEKRLAPEGSTSPSESTRPPSPGSTSRTATGRASTVEDTEDPRSSPASGRGVRGPGNARQTRSTRRPQLHEVSSLSQRRRGRKVSLNEDAIDNGEKEGPEAPEEDLWQQSSLADIDARDCVPRIEEPSPFSFYADPKPGVQVLFFRDIGTPLPTLELPSDDPLQTSKSFGKEPDEDLWPFTYGPLEDLEPSEQSSVSADQDDREESDHLLEGPWSARDIFKPITTHLQLKTWESFHVKSSRPPFNGYLLESGPQLFGETPSGRIIPDVSVTRENHSGQQSNVVLLNLIQLAFGRDSLLYRYDHKEATFQPVLEGIRTSEDPPECFAAITTTLVSYGSQIRRLKEFSEATQESRRASVSLVALASGINTVVATFEAEMSGPLASVKTASQLEALLDWPGSILETLSFIIDEVENAVDDNDVLSMVFDVAQDLERSAPRLQPIINQLVAYASIPWLESLEAFVGLKADYTRGTQCMKTSDNQLEDCKLRPGIDTDLEDGKPPKRRIPSFISSDMLETILETEESLRLLQTHQPEHLLARPQGLPSLEAPSLQWHFSQLDIERMEAQAQTYENNVLQALKEFIRCGTFNHPRKPAIEEYAEDLWQSLEYQEDTDLIAQIETPVLNLFRPTISPLRSTVIHFLSNTPTPDGDSSNIFMTMDRSQSHISPPTSVLPTLSFAPILTAQSRVLSHSILHLLLHTYCLRFHLRLLHSYPLFANGPFLVHFSHALFDTTLSSAAYQRGRLQADPAGLQLGITEVWPPSSSELRIALEGILSESYYSSFCQANAGTGKGWKETEELPGGLSFAIRNNMSDAELERCMNADGLEALDFLKMQYKPPKPLDAVITDEALEKYEKISRLLLRGARVGWVTREMARHQRSTDGIASRSRFMQRFRIEAYHFVTTVFGYFQESIEVFWSAFEDKLDGIEASVNCYDMGKKVEGVYRLRELHEEVLDLILAALFLRKKQESVMKLFEEILELVLRLAKTVKEKRSYSGDKEDEKVIQDLYEQWRKKVWAFITVCRGLQDQNSVSGRTDVFDGAERGEEKGYGIERLVLGLEMNGWYMR
ncbi:MAG: hypothetical protein Q9200_003909 [Gallowayella weberi]